MLQRPIKNLDQLRTILLVPRNIAVKDSSKLDIQSIQFEMHFNFHPIQNTVAGVRLAVGNGHYFEIGYDASNQKLYVDRSKTANQNFNAKFGQLSRYETPLVAKGNNIDLHIYFDNSIVEVFANDGECVMTTQIFPSPDEKGIQFFSNNGPSQFSNVTVWGMRSAWK
jgi:sucrose-6-phosphate hydrolase SacC (GH32 family)